MHGIINFDKPPKMSSAMAVRCVKRLLPPGTKIGHAGTLDPFATGVLLLLVGKAAKSCERLMDEPKQYLTTVKLGANTETDDPESPEKIVENATEPPEAAVRAVIQRMVGIISQRPPRYSAVKIGGRRAYALARRGKPVDPQPREVRIDAIEILSWAWPVLKLRIDCGRGTYIRAIARDLGEDLKTGGYLTELRRTRVGRFYAEQSVSLETLQRDGVEPHLQEIQKGQ
jgi:tRNA pseudouridine55 synthase